MIKKLSIVLLVISLLICMVLPLQDVYAKDNFFEIKKQEVAKEENVELIINLDKVKYDKFKIELISDVELSNINTDENIELKKDDNEIYIEIDKEVTKLNKIILNYKVPEDKKVGDNIIFIGNVINLENESETQTEQLKITIIENKKEEEKTDNNNNEKIKDSENVINTQKIKTNISNMKNVKAPAGVTKSVGNTTRSVKQAINVEKVEYKGSNNNYLSKLSIKGYKLNKEFCKDNNTYFANIDSDVSSVNITAKKEDDTSKICIYGNENLKQGINKILINVTAENGNVRTYRIYVTKT